MIHTVLKTYKVNALLIMYPNLAFICMWTITLAAAFYSLSLALYYSVSSFVVLVIP